MTCSSELSVSRRLGLAVIWRTFIKKSHNKRLLYKQHSRWECPPPSPYVFFVQNSIAIVGSLGLFCPFNSPEAKGSASLSSQSPFDILIPCQCFPLESKNILFVCKFYPLKLVLKNVICVPTIFWQLMHFWIFNSHMLTVKIFLTQTLLPLIVVVIFYRGPSTCGWRSEFEQDKETDSSTTARKL